VKINKLMTKIFVYDEFNPEDSAMMQALYSRSPESVEVHAKKVKASGSGKFMAKFYVGYGHMSIADCGSTTLFIEGLSMLADKAIQDWPLYSGQETSTRYINMSKQKIIDPIGTKNSKKILDNWMKFYIGSQEELKKHLRKKYPRKENEDEKMYEKAIDARAFDSLRGFLPAGITTQLSWHTNLRQAWDKLALMHHHPVPEIREIADDILGKLKRKYASSFSHPRINEQEKYWEFLGKKYNYFDPEKVSKFSFETSIKKSELEKYQDIINKRSAKTGLPHFMSELGRTTFNFLLDFGSFRDIQRHRNGVCRMPLLTTKHGFHQWYLDQLPINLRKQAEKLIIEQKKAIKKLKAKLEIIQYYVAMGFNVPCRVSYALPAALYVTELRSNRTVHPTLRKIAHQMHSAFKKKFPKLKMQCDLSMDDWDARRGLQDITMKK